MLQIDYMGYGFNSRARVPWDSVICAIHWVIWLDRNATVLETSMMNLEGFGMEFTNELRKAMPHTF